MSSGYRKRHQMLLVEVWLADDCLKLIEHSLRSDHFVRSEFQQLFKEPGWISNMPLKGRPIDCVLCLFAIDPEQGVSDRLHVFWWII